jgi:hypothetical protein
MRQILAITVMAVISACGGNASPGLAAHSPPASSVSPSSPASPAGVPSSPTQASPTASGAPVLPLTAVAFSCRLPAYRRGGEATSWFIDFPARSVSDTSELGTFYDPAVSRWLPVFQNQVSPDGRRYAYTEGWSASPPSATRVHVVDAGTGADVRVVAMPDTQPYFVIDFTGTGVDLGIGFEGRGQGVWRLDPGTGVVTKVSDGLYPPDAQWIGVVDANDPQPYGSAMTGMPGENRIDHRDAAGRTTTWFYRPGHAVRWIAFATNSALLVRSDWSDPTKPNVGGTEYWLVTAPNQATELAAYTFQETSPYLDLSNGFPTARADSHGIWIGGEQSLYLVTLQGAVLRVYPKSAYPASGCS